jgi:GT2 family glycosyltransferase
MEELTLSGSSVSQAMAECLAGTSTRARREISIVVPTYRRESVLLDSIEYLLNLDPGPAEILIVDQTKEHEAETTSTLRALDNAGKIRWFRLPEPSITGAMNAGLIAARQDIVLFLDDDVIPRANLIKAHSRAHQSGSTIVAGQVLQPGEEPEPRLDKPTEFRFRSSTPQAITELMGGNFSIRRDVALRLGGFDENFVQVAYRFEAEFAARALAAGEKILFEPEASIRHLKANAGGTRTYGEHLTTIKPSHSVGEYYYLLRSKQIPRRLFKIIARPFRAIRTRHHLYHPWWIPATLIAEGWGFLWAVALAARGPRLIGKDDGRPTTGDRRPEDAGKRRANEERGTETND